MNTWITLLFAMLLNTSITNELTVLSVRVLDGNDNLLPCRAWIEVNGNRLFEPQSPIECTPYERDQSFSCPGYFSIQVPPGEARIRVEKGKEYVPLEVNVPASNSRDPITIRLERWINMPKESWYSTDMHVHLGSHNPEVLKQLGLADDVHLTPAFTYWLRGREPRWPDQWPDWLRDGEEKIDSTHIVTHRNVEIERIRKTSAPGESIGATFLFNLHQPVSVERYGEHFPTDTTLCLNARKHSPKVVIDTDKPSWAETVVGAALGAYDTVQVCHNHYHREQDIAGGWGMIAPLVPGESNASEGDGLFHRTNSLYYRLLNCGFRLGVSGGSAIGVMPVPMGYSRVYARIEGDFTSDKLWEGVKAGRTFATSGPMLELTVDGNGPGSSVRPTSTGVEVNTRIRSIDRLEAVQLIQNGEIVGSKDLNSFAVEPPLDHSTSWQIRPKRSGWLAARVLFRTPAGNLRQAHTSPVYFVVGEKPTAHKNDALYMIRWIDQLVKIAHQDGRFPKRVDRQRVLADYTKARSVYKKVVSDAEEFWGD